MGEAILPFPDKKYQIIYADPPWRYRDKRKNPKTDRPRKYGGIGYPTMAVEEICELPVKNISDDNCILFIWVTFPILEEVFKVIKAWGFEYKTLGFSWIKINKNDGKPFFGIGHYTKSNCEVCLIGLKGKVKPISDQISSVIISKRGIHSEKPHIIREKIVKLCGDLPRIELFFRYNIPGWDCWGDEKDLIVRPENKKAINPFF